MAWSQTDWDSKGSGGWNHVNVHHESKAAGAYCWQGSSAAGTDSWGEGTGDVAPKGEEAGGAAPKGKGTGGAAPNEDRKWEGTEWLEIMNKKREAKYLHKVRLCTLFIHNKCDYGDTNCRFAHHLSDLKVPDEGENGEHAWSQVWSNDKGAVHRWFGQTLSDDAHWWLEKYFWRELRLQEQWIPDWAYAYAIIHLHHVPTRGPVCDQEDWGMREALQILKEGRGGKLPQTIPARFPAPWAKELSNAYHDLVPSPDGLRWENRRMVPCSQWMVERGPHQPTGPPPTRLLRPEQLVPTQPENVPPHWKKQIPRHLRPVPLLLGVAALKAAAPTSPKSSPISSPPEVAAGKRLILKGDGH